MPTLDDVDFDDLPFGQVAFTKAVTITHRDRWFSCSVRTREKTDLGKLSAHAGISRCAGKGTKSKHSASLSGVPDNDLPANYEIE